MLFGAVLNLALISLLVPVFGKYIGAEKEKTKRALNFIGIGGIFFLLSKGFTIDVLATIPKFGFIEDLFSVIGIIYLIVGTIWAAWLTSAKKKE